MPLNSTSVSIGHIGYEPTINGPINIHVDDKPLLDLLNSYLPISNISVGNPFNKDSKQIEFVPQVEEVCFKVFDAIKQIKLNSGKELDAALLGARLYESLQPGSLYESLQSIGRDYCQLGKVLSELSYGKRFCQ